MPRAPKLSSEEFARRSPGAKGIYRTGKKGQKYYISYDPLHPLPRGRGSRLLYKRGARLSPRLADIKRSQELAERRKGIKKGTGLFDDPLSSNPQVIGVTRIVRKQQIKAIIRKYQSGKIKKLPKRVQAKVDKMQRGSKGKMQSSGVKGQSQLVRGPVIFGKITK